MIDAINNWIGGLSAMQQFTLFSGVKILGVFSVLMFCVAYAVWVERKVAAAIQDRIGPNRAGIFGLLQPACDAVKSFLKEDFTPDHVRKAYFWIAPAVMMIPALMTVAVIPFGSTMGNPLNKMVIADLNVGVLYTFGIVSLGVYGIVLAGYAANSKYPFLGGIRSSAQLISYELAMGLSVIPLFLWVGDLNLSQLVLSQTGFVSWLPDALGGFRVPNWLVFQSPMLALSFGIFLVSAFAETNRTPFDLPEAEQELAGGYNVEYSSMKFALFFMGEYANMIAASAMMVTLFFGGWTLPWFGLDQPASGILSGLLHIGIFFVKVVAFVFIIIWVRWMWPRFRYDQLMDLGWRRFMPLALVNIVVTAIWLWWRSTP
jgi:NADH-quinone oxidoreductase subunit H